MGEWQKLLAQSIDDAETLSKKLKINKKYIEKVISKYPMKISSYYLRLIQKKGDSIWNQCVPDIREITLDHGLKDPLLEKKHMPIPGMIHRYPDRVLLLVSNVCAGYCRFCTRKRRVGIEGTVISKENIKKVITYIQKHTTIRDVLLSGGDPLVLEDAKIESFLKHLRKIHHIQIIRIDSRTPCFLPQRITPKFCRMLQKYHPIYFNTHFNHPDEITKESAQACSLLVDYGVVMGNQSVLLKGVNDSATILKQLHEKLLSIRVRPYYLYLPDAVQGTYHFRVSITKALKIMRQLIGHTSGLAVPHLIVDLVGGGGKTPILPQYIVKQKGRRYTFKNFEGKTFHYDDVR
ncbi:KamA family radical SAM protein [Candidatus Margulisiibacteriota bacterium]